MEPEICLFEKYIIVYSCEYHILILSFFFFIKKSSFVIIEKEQNKNKTKNKDLKTSIFTNVKTNETDNDIFDAYGSGGKRHDGTEDADMKKGGEEQTRPTSAAIFGEDKILLLFDDNKSDIDGEEKDKRDGRGENEKDTDKIGHGNEKDANITPVHFDFVAFKSVEMLYIADAATCMKKEGEGYTGPNSVEAEVSADAFKKERGGVAGGGEGKDLRLDYFGLKSSKEMMFEKENGCVILMNFAEVYADAFKKERGGEAKGLRLDFKEDQTSTTATTSSIGTDTVAGKGDRSVYLYRFGRSIDAAENFKEADSALQWSKEMMLEKENGSVVLMNFAEVSADDLKKERGGVGVEGGEAKVLSKESTKIFEKNVLSVLGIFSFVDTLKKNCLSLMQLAFGFLAKVIYFFAGLSQPTPTAVVFGFLAKALTSLFVFFQGNSLNKLFPSMILLLFPLVSVAASNTTTTSISMHKSSLCDINDAVPFKQMDATLGECKYQCISLHTCSGMQYVDPKQCILYDVPFSSVSV